MSGSNNKESIKAESLPVTIHAQYVRDMSFENPKAPHSLRPGDSAPQMDINIGMDARKIPDNDALAGMYEVVLNVRAAALDKDKTPLFIAEIQYAVLCSIGENVPEDTRHPLLLIEMPRMAFPFVRQILCEATQHGGFPPLLLTPVDFTSLYMQQFGAEMDKAALDGEE